MTQYSRSGSNNNNWLIPMLLAVALIIGILLGLILSQSGENSLFIKYETESKFGGGDLDEVFNLIENKYYRKINIDSLKQSALAEIFSKLDPYSTYIDAKENKVFNDQMNGQYDGIGIEYILLEDQVCIIKVIEAGPAKQAGLKPGDIILDVLEGNRGIKKLTAKELIQKLSTQQGPEIQLLISRKSQSEPISINIKRDKIDLPGLGKAVMMNDSVAYIHIKRFNAQTYRSFMEQLEQFIEMQGFRDIVIDVRGNTGGYLQEVVNILSQLFKEKGKILVSTKGNHQKTTEYTSTGKAFFNIRKVAVLIDEQTASASEILAGTLQDHDRGLVVGSPSFGKGTVQEQFNLKSGGAVRLSVARYFLPSGRSIQKAYEQDFYINQDSSSIYKSGRGKILAGNQGILPDIDTRASKSFSLNDQPELLQSVSSYLFMSIRDLSTKDKTSFVEIQNPQSPVYLNIFKGLIAELGAMKLDEGFISDLSAYFHHKLMYSLLDTEAFYKWIFQYDTTILAALENLHASENFTKK